MSSEKQLPNKQIITHNDHRTPIFSYKTQKNTNYLVTIQISAKNLSKIGGGVFYQLRRVTNDNNNVTISSALTNIQNTTIAGSAIMVTISGKNLIIEVVGANDTTVQWVAVVDILASN